MSPTEEQVETILRGADALPPDQLASYLDAVAALLRGRVIGDLSVRCAVLEARRRSRQPGK